VEAGFPKRSCSTKKLERQSIQTETIAVEIDGLKTHLWPRPDRIPDRGVTAAEERAPRVRFSGFLASRLIIAGALVDEVEGHAGVNKSAPD
jgi:hypothetical protein